MTVKVITDSTSYIDREIAENLGIIIVPLSVCFGEDSVLETHITNDEFYPLMEEKGIPVSSQPSPGEMAAVMEPMVALGHDVVGIFLSTDMSGTCASAEQAKEELLGRYPQAKIQIIDSRSNSMQLGFSVLAAAQAAEEGGDLETVTVAATDIIARSRFLFTPKNLTYLQKGGRIGGASALLGNLLSLMPILTVEDGKVVVVKTVRTKKRAIEAMLEHLMDDHAKFTVQKIAVHHINCLQEAEGLRDKIQALLPVQVDIQAIGPVIGLHVGPGTVGMVYYTSQPLR